MDNVINELIKEFGSDMAEEMIARIMCGESVDSAIQTVLERYE